MTLKNKRYTAIVILTTLILFIPIAAMQLTNEVNWTLFDFILAGLLLLGTALMIEFVLRKVRSLRNRIAICGVILFALILVWIELAVGIFGTPFAGS